MLARLLVAPVAPERKPTHHVKVSLVAWEKKRILWVFLRMSRWPGTVAICSCRGASVRGTLAQGVASSPPDTLAHLFRCHTRGWTHRLRELAPDSTRRTDCRCHSSPFPDQQECASSQSVAKFASGRHQGVSLLSPASRRKGLAFRKLRSGRSGGRLVQATLVVGVMLLPFFVVAVR